jgi:4-hydroxybenzoate polyprenyltransferase
MVAAQSGAGRPLRNAIAGLALEVRPLPMAAVLLAALLGGQWAGMRLGALPASMPLLLLAVFFGLYTAHLMDTYIDVVKRHDFTPADYPLLFRDSSGLFPERAYPWAVAASATLCAAASVPPVQAGGVLVAIAMAAGVLVALAYAPLLDRHTLGVSLAYPVGVVAANAAGYALVAGALDFRWLALAATIFFALTGTKIRSDIIDLDDDKKIGKRTVPVLLGRRAGLAVGYGIAMAGLGLAAALPLLISVTPWIAAPPLAAAAGLVISARLDALRGSLLMASVLLGLLAAEVAVLGAC